MKDTFCKWVLLHYILFYRFKHFKSPLVYTGYGKYVGDERAFLTYVKKTYGITNDLDDSKLNEIAKENEALADIERIRSIASASETKPKRALVIVGVQVLVRNGATNITIITYWLLLQPLLLMTICHIY
mgnify:CR=1 FL=1